MDKYEAWSKDGRYGLRVPASALQDMLALCRTARSDETGGILVGYYTRALDAAIVTHVSPPPKDSRFGRSFFYRGVSGLQKWLLSLWTHRVRRYYLGEWHFHPYASAEPSSIDLAQMKKNACDSSYNCPEPILLIIGGDPDNGWSMRSFICIRGDPVLELTQEWQK